eukprot:1179756-Prorocentrum_minimum.AAC.5
MCRSRAVELHSPPGGPHCALRVVVAQRMLHVVYVSATVRRVPPLRVRAVRLPTQTNHTKPPSLTNITRIVIRAPIG